VAPRVFFIYMSEIHGAATPLPAALAPLRATWPTRQRRQPHRGDSGAAPYAVLLLDEVEKAHPEVFSTVAAGWLDDGRLTDSQGRPWTSANNGGVMTSNLASRAILGARPSGPSKDSEANAGMPSLDEAVEQATPPPVPPQNSLNRIDELIRFRPAFGGRIYSGIGAAAAGLS